MKWQSMEYYLNIKTVTASDKKQWRNWLSKNHIIEKSVWLIIYKKDSGTPSITYDDAVDEALCFGWIDSKPNKRDDESYYQFFAKRNPKSKWSRINKEKVERLINERRMTEEGLKMIEAARQSGTWTALDEIENLTLPIDLASAFSKNKTAFDNWNNFPRSVKRSILEWISNAKKEETRSGRIAQTVSLAEKNSRANQYRN